MIQDEGLYDVLSYHERASISKLEDYLHIENIFWHEKDKLNWNLKGDINTKFFHMMVKIKYATKLISAL